MITVYTLENSKEWDSIVKSFNDHDVYYLSGYVKAFKLHGDGEPLLIYFQSGDTRAINVVIKRDLSDYKYFKEEIEKNKFFDITTPYGYGGFIVEGDNFQALKDEYSKFCKEQNWVCEFVRFHPFLQNQKKLTEIYEVIHLGETVYINAESEEIIFQNLTSKNRNMIRKAQKNNLKVACCRTPLIIDKFMEIYNATMDKDRADNYYYFDRGFYESILNDLEENALWFYVEKDNEIIAISIFMFCNGKMHYHLSGSKREFQGLAPTNLLLYEAAIWAFNNGYKRLHLGGGVGAGKDNLYKFKKAFNREDDLNFYIGKRIYNEDLYKKLIELRKSRDNDFDENTSYFPAYRG